MNISTEEFQLITKMIEELCGIILTENKTYLIKNRLEPVAKNYNFESYYDMFYGVKYGNNKKLENDIIDAITTNETLFFRDDLCYKKLKDVVIPTLIQNRKKSINPKKLRIWSAASSTGQEPYSIAITLSEIIPDIDSWDIQITATDISDFALNYAQEAKYSDHEIGRGLHSQYQDKYFTKIDTRWQLSDKIKNMVKFRKINLLDTFTLLGTFDLIFCRNVAIYFSPEIQADLFLRLTKQLTTDGFLFAGASESLSRFHEKFMPCENSTEVYYQPNVVRPPNAA